MRSDDGLGRSVGAAIWLSVAMPIMALAGCAGGDDGPTTAAPVVAREEKAAVVLTARPEGGYDFSGPYELSGTLTPEGGRWRLIAEFIAPPGWSAGGEPELVLLKRLPPHAIVTVILAPQESGTAASQVAEEHTIDMVLGVPTDATFDVRIEMSKPAQGADG